MTEWGVGFDGRLHLRRRGGWSECGATMKNGHGANVPVKVSRGKPPEMAIQCAECVTINQLKETTMDIYNQYQYAIADLSDTDREDVDRQTRMASAYVWGWQDGRGYDADTAAANDFAWTYGIHAADYAAGRSCYRRPICDAFKAYAGNETLARS